MFIEISKEDFSTVLQLIAEEGDRQRDSARELADKGEHEFARAEYEFAQKYDDLSARVKDGDFSNASWEVQVGRFIRGLREIVSEFGRVADAGPWSETKQFDAMCGAVGELRKVMGK